MYVYDEYDQRIIEDRVKQFRDQTRRYLAGELSEEEFRPLRLQNGLYIQRFAPMLRVAVPYGQLTSRQTRMMARIARDYDKGYAHISTRQNVQFNWPALEDIPDILAELATVQMHAIQTSGNCLRNVTTDQFAGVAADELIDPRPWCEIVRQWTTFHPEFAYLPRKFKIAINGSTSDRAAIEVHDIGLEAVRNAAGEIGFRVLVGGGLGVWLDADEEAEEIGDDVDQFQVIALNFPAFTDGRNYSPARLLRDRYGFKGELRAIGDVLRDQLFYMRRCGFDAFALRADKDPYDALESLKDFSVTYQAATDEPQPLFRRR